MIEYLALSLLLLAFCLGLSLVHLARGKKPTLYVPPLHVTRRPTDKPRIVVQSDERAAEIEEKRLKEQGWPG